MADVRLSVPTMISAFERLYNCTPSVTSFDFWQFAHAMHIRIAFRKGLLNQEGVGKSLDPSPGALDHYMAIVHREFENEKTGEINGN